MYIPLSQYLINSCFIFSTLSLVAVATYVSPSQSLQATSVEIQESLHSELLERPSPNPRFETKKTVSSVKRIIIYIYRTKVSKIWKIILSRTHRIFKYLVYIAPDCNRGDHAATTRYVISGVSYVARGARHSVSSRRRC